MRLKIWTTAFFLTGVVLLVGWPWIVGPKPADTATKQELARYGLRVLMYFGLTATVFLVTAILALLVMRRTRKEFLEESGKNLQGLIESTLEDHAQKRR
ncbi:MAG: hypothetical protein HONBIEJF_01124 [Fimbriimonadaceae bacterium]|nr:hypothetical protein [Fimbriimonadaceae bacterium]